jgi:hypothetical protein
MRPASLRAFLNERMSVTWLPMWKWRSSTQSSKPGSFKRSIVCTISSTVRPNFAESPAEDSQRPEPRLASLERMPRCGAEVPLARDGDDVFHLARLLDHDDRIAAELLRQERGHDVLVVLVPVADDERVGVVEEREHDQQLGLAAGLEPHVVGPKNLTRSSTMWRCWLTLIGYTPRKAPWKPYSWNALPNAWTSVSTRCCRRSGKRRGRAGGSRAGRGPRRAS